MAKFEIEGVSIEVPDHLLNGKIFQKMSEGMYEYAEARAAKMRVKPGHRVLELGGGIGYISSICAQITAPENILTIEANPDIIEVIKNNLATNNASSARVVHGAVVEKAEENETILFRIGSAFWGSSIAGVNDLLKKTIEVPALSFFELIMSHRPNVIIMDIEGSECSLFDRPFPRFVQSILMEIHPKSYPDTTIKRIFDSASRSGLVYDTRVSRGTMVGFVRAKG